MIREIQAKVLLSHVKQPDTWFGLKYNMNLYRGCQHRCIYCDSRSECYGIDHFDTEVLVKANAIDLLRDELSRKQVKGPIGTGSMNDPYMPVEREVQLMRRALEVIAAFGFPVHVLTKSDLVLRDVSLLEEIQRRTRAAISFTITTADDALAAKVEPYSPRPSARFQAMRALAEHGIMTGVTMMPILPFIEDNEANICQIVTQAHANGATYIIPSFGMTLRDRQRAHYYEQLEAHFPGLRARYERACGESYTCSARNADRLRRLFYQLCEQYNIAPQMPPYPLLAASQMTLF